MPHNHYSRAGYSVPDANSSVDRLGKSKCSCDKENPVVRPLNNRPKEAFDHLTYHLGNKSSCCDIKVARGAPKRAKRLKVQVRSQVLDSFDPFFILGFLSAFNCVLDMNGVHKGAPLRLLQFFMELSATGPITEPIKFKWKSHTYQQKGTVTSYWNLSTSCWRHMQRTM